MVLKRIIPSLLLRGGRLVKGVTYADHRDAGRPETTARAHNAQGADELLLIDIDASREKREPDFASVASGGARLLHAADGRRQHQRASRRRSAA